MPELFPNINASADVVPIAAPTIVVPIIAVRTADLIAEPIADPDVSADTHWQCARRAILERRGERGVDAGETQDYDDERVVKQHWSRIDGRSSCEMKTSS